MTHEKLFKLALEALEAHADIGIKSDKAITALKERLAQPEQEQQIETLKRCLFQMQEAAKDLVEQAKSLPPPQRTWVGLMRGVRVEGDAVVIRVHGGNDEARALCGELINEMEKNT